MDSLNYLKDSLPKETVAQKWHRITHRVLFDLQHRCMRRTVPEEWNLATKLNQKDSAKAEVIRICRSGISPGLSPGRRLEEEEAKVFSDSHMEDCNRCATSDNAEKSLRHFPGL